MKLPWDDPLALRFQIAYNARSQAPQWEEVSGQDTVMGSGVQVTKGRPDAFSRTMPSQCSLWVDNSAGGFSDTDGAKPKLFGKRLRFSYRDPASLGLFNLLAFLKDDIEAGSFPAGNWWTQYFGGTSGTTLTSSTARAFIGTKSVLVTWSGSASPGAGFFMPAATLVKGRRYVASIPVFVPAGSPAVKFGDVFGATPVVTSTATDRWQVLTVSFVAAGFSAFIGLLPATTPSAGQQVWFDLPMFDEAIGTEPATSVDSGRINFLLNPNFEVDAANWAAYTGVAAPTRVTTTPFSGAGRLEAIGNNTSTAPRVAQTLTGFVVGDTWTLQAKVRQDGTFPTGGTAIAALRWQLTAGGETVQNVNPAFAPASNGYMLITLTGTVPAGCNGTLVINLGFAGLASNLTAAGSIGVDEAFLEKAASAGPYFDGALVNDHPFVPIAGGGAFVANGSATVTTGVSFQGRDDWTRAAVTVAGHGARRNYPTRSLMASRSYVVDFDVANDTGTARSMAVDLCDGTAVTVSVAAGEAKHVTMTLTPGANADVVPTTYRFLDLAVMSIGSLLFRNVTVTPVAPSVTVWGGPANGSISQQFADAFNQLAPPIRDRFTGYISSNELTMITPSKARTSITAGDRMPMLERHKLRSVVAETIAVDKPKVYYPLGEQTGSTVFSDISTNGQPTLTLTQRGTGGTFEAAAGTGAPTDGHSSPIFTPVDANNGLYLAGALTTGIGFFGIDLAANINTTVNSRIQIAATLLDIYGYRYEVGTDATGKALGRAFNPFNGGFDVSLASAGSVADGQNHDVALTASIAGSTITWSLLVDGVSVATTTTSGSALPFAIYLQVGGGSVSPLFTGTISHVRAFSGALSTATHLAQRTALTTGFAGEKSSERLTRYASWAGIPTTDLLLDTAANYSGAMGHLDTEGMSVWDAMSACDDVEGAGLFINGSGLIVLNTRTSTWNQAAAAVIPAVWLKDQLRFPTDPAQLANDITATRPGGGSVHVIDQASIDDYDTAPDQLTIAAATDDQVLDIANWHLHLRAQPKPRAASAGVNLHQVPADLATALLAVELGDRVDIPGLPAQSPNAASLSVLINGWRESYSQSGTEWVADATPHEQVLAWTLEDPVLGTLDGPGVLIY